MKNSVATQAHHVRSFLSITSLVVLCYFATIAIPTKQFPGYYALLPVIFSFVIIVCGIHPSWLNNGISAPVRYIGRISYSIYLIHYPVIFIFLYLPFTNKETLNISDQIYAVVITIALSIILYHSVEQGFRSRKKISDRNFIKTIIGFYVFSIIAILGYSQSNYFSGFYSQEENKIFIATNDRRAYFRCSKLQKLKEIGEKSCYLLQNDSASKRVYLVGDSHIDVMKSEFIELAHEKRASVRLNRNNCFLGKGECSSDRIIKQVQEYKITDIVLHGYQYSKFDYDNLEKLIIWSEANGVSIHFIGPVPTYKQSIPELLYQEYHTQMQLLERYTKDSFIGSIPISYSEFVKGNKSRENVSFYFPEDYLCTSNICQVESDEGVLYYDPHHLTLTGARKLRPMIQQIMN